MLIKLLYGTYGAEERGVIVAKTNKSAPFCVEEKRGRALIESGYAMAIDDAHLSESSKQADSGGKEDAKDNMDDCSLQDLRRMAKEMGLSAGGSKQEILDRIRAEESGEISAAEARNNEESLRLTPSEPEV